MLNIKLLTELSFRSINDLGHNGYISDVIYKAEKNSDKETISFVLKPEKQNVPYFKTWKLTDENIDHYRRIISEGYSFGAYENNELAGIVLCEERKWNNTLYIENLLVSESQRGKGIGKSLMKKVIETAAQNNLRHIELETQNTNGHAIGFYSKLGFSVTGMNLTLYDPDENNEEVAIFMVYDLMKKQS